LLSAALPPPEHAFAGFNMRSPEVVLTTHGRFHSFDLAEQLQNSGMLRAIFTPYPKFKLRNTKVDPRFIRPFPVMSALQRIAAASRAPSTVKQMLQLYTGEAIDFYAKQTRPNCNIVMALSGGGLASGREIQRQGGGYVCDRGSTHMRYQMRLLAEEYDRVGVPFDPVHERSIVREECEYEAADAITVPSRFALRSFVECGVDAAKLHAIPYGVDLRQFAPVAARDVTFRVLFVGHLGVRKGVGYLLRAFRTASLPDAKLVFVGSRNAETKFLLGNDSLNDIEFTGALTREQVAVEMSRASVMVLPSIEEGLAMVQGQALASGCPVIATTNTGAEDLFTDGREGFIVPIRDPDAIASALVRLYEDRELLQSMSRAARERVEQIGGWDRYGAEIIALFHTLLNRRI
jgi:starch synthase